MAKKKKKKKRKKIRPKEKKFLEAQPVEISVSTEISQKKRKKFFFLWGVVGGIILIAFAGWFFFPLHKIEKVKRTSDVNILPVSYTHLRAHET